MTADTNERTGDQVDRGSGGLVHRHISRENISAQRLLRVPPTARKLTRHPPERTSAVLQVLPGGIRVKRATPGPEKPHAGGGARGAITGFSEESRRRLIQKLMALDWSAGSVYFVTLTWHESAGVDPKRWKSALDKFAKRLDYHYGALVRGFLWRLEFATRKSGASMGRPMPHYHLVLFWRARGPHMATFRRFVAAAWHEIADPTSEKHAKAGTQVLKARNTAGLDMSKLLHYLAKYLGKVERFRLVDPATGELMRSGRIWGERVNFGGDETALPYVVVGAFELDRGEYLEFLGKVNEYGDQVGSWYMSAVTDQWRGFSIMGDGLLLLDRLLSGSGVDLSNEKTWLSGSARGCT